MARSRILNQVNDESNGVAVADVPYRHRFEVYVEDELAGVAEYVDHDEQRIFYHTEIDERYSGQGLGNTLIRSALTDTRSSGRRIVPVCPFVARYLKKNDDFADIVDPVTPKAVDFVRSTLG